MSETIQFGRAKLMTANTSAVKNRAPEVMLSRSIGARSNYLAQSIHLSLLSGSKIFSIYSMIDTQYFGHLPLLFTALPINKYDFKGTITLYQVVRKLVTVTKRIYTGNPAFHSD